MFDKNTIVDSKSNSQSSHLSFKKVLFVIILSAILFSIAGALIYLKPLSKKATDISEEKNKILKRVNLYEKGSSPLTNEEKNEIYDKLSDTKIQEYDFSKEEKIKLLKALNNK